MSRSKKTVTQRSQTIKCKGCDIRFTPKDGRQHYHNPQCRIKYYEKHYSNMLVTKTCANPKCGGSFATTMPKKQHFCKPECREEHRRDVQDELTARVHAETRTFLGERYAAMQRDNFKCVYCSRGKDQGVVLDVMEDNHELKTVCLECKTGREFLGEH